MSAEIPRQEFDDAVNAVVDAWDDTADAMYEDVVASVHPGFCEYRNYLDQYQSLDRDEYEQVYKHEFATSIEQYLEQETPVYVMYPASNRTHTELFLGSLALDTAAFTYVVTNPYDPLPEVPDMIGTALSRVTDGGTVHVTGEINGKCASTGKYFMEQVVEQVDPDITIEQDTVFPEQYVKFLL